MNLLKKISRTLSPLNLRQAAGKEGCRAYAIGDIHGRLDLLDKILMLVERHISSRPPLRNFIVFLGDLIDRGSDSAGVVERLRTYKPDSAKTVFLSGNHEEVLLRILAGETGILYNWLKFGGAECAASYGIDPQRLKETPEKEALEILRTKIPASHRHFVDSFGDTFRFGDYLFVHAGIRPGLGIQEQDRSDLRWIRDPFLSDTQEHGFIVVHGHTVVGAVEEKKNRIAIDTGAYRTGNLTALAVERDARWYLSTGSAST